MNIEALRAIEDAQLPIYVLAGEHRRHVAEFGTHGFAISHDEEGKRVDIGVLRKGSSVRCSGQSVRIDVRDTLATRLLLTRHQRVPAGADDAAWFTSIASEAREAGPWEPVPINVDSRQTSFWRLEADDHWIAFADLGESWLYIHSLGTRLESLEVVRVEDLRNSLG